MPLVAGVDCSTQATKVLVVDVDDGKVVAEGRHGHEVTGTGGARESEPRGWWRALAAALAATGRAGDVEAISIAGQQHGLCVLDAAGEPLRPAMLWNDTRAAPDAQRLRDTWGPEQWAEQVGVVPVASFTAAKWAWLRRLEPDVADATRSVRLPHDLLTGWLTGDAATDRSDVSGTAWWSSRTEAYDEHVLGLPTIDLDPAMLPRVLGPTDVAGDVTTSARRQLGLADGCVVGPGCGDNAGAALALGVGAGTPVVSLGTSGTAFAPSRTRTVDASGMIAGFADAAGGFLPLAATLNCTLAVDRIASWLHLDRDDVAASTHCIVLPYLDGERTPDLPSAAGTIMGLRHDTTPQQILRAAYEGAASSLLEAIEGIDRVSSGVDAEAPLVVVGGGARGDAWRAVLGDLSGRALRLPAQTELVAVGAAVQAAAVLAGSSPAEVSTAWGSGDGLVLAPPDVGGAARLAALQEARERAGDLLGAPWPLAR